MFPGDALLVPITEVGSVASALGWLAACAAFYQMRPALRQRFVAMLGVVLCILMVSMKIVPAIPGHFTAYEWLALTMWILLGLVLNWRERATGAVSAGTDS
jgi:hypothetical protein